MIPADLIMASPDDFDDGGTSPATPLIPASFPSGKRWYVVNTYRQREARARNEIDELGLEVYLPLETYMRTRPGRRKKEPAQRPAFPQYLFVRFDINHEDRWAPILSLHSVRGLLGQNNIPSHVPDWWIEKVGELEGSGVFDASFNLEDLPKGQRLQIIDGPFEHQIGELLEAESKDRGIMLVRLFDQLTKVRFDVDDVRKI